MEVVHAIFTFDGISPAIIGARRQSFLHVFADANIFLLYLIAECNGSGRNLRVPALLSDR